MTSAQPITTETQAALDEMSQLMADIESLSLEPPTKAVETAPAAGSPETSGATTTSIKSDAPSNPEPAVTSQSLETSPTTAEDEPSVVAAEPSNVDDFKGSSDEASMEDTLSGIPSEEPAADSLLAQSIVSEIDHELLGTGDELSQEVQDVINGVKEDLERDLAELNHDESIAPVNDAPTHHSPTRPTEQINPTRAHLSPEEATLAQLIEVAKVIPIEPPKSMGGSHTTKAQNLVDDLFNDPAMLAAIQSSTPVQSSSSNEKNLHHNRPLPKEFTSTQPDTGSEVKMTMSGDMKLQLTFCGQGHEVTISFENETLVVQTLEGAEFRLPLKSRQRLAS